MPTTIRTRLRSLLRFASNMLRSIWLFFPGILFLIFSLMVFWTLGQGKDIIIAFTENQSRTFFGFNYTRTIFFISIGFWIYVSWYSSRIISYIKKSKQVDTIQELGSMDRPTAEQVYESKKESVELTSGFLSAVPRLIGNACFLILEISVLRSPLLKNPIGVTAGLIILVAGLVLTGLSNRWIQNRHAFKPYFRKLFYIFLYVMLGLIIIVSFGQKINIHVLLLMLILLHLLFIIYINLRRVVVEQRGEAIHESGISDTTPHRSTIQEKLMNFFCVPLKESGYFKWFLIVGAAGIIVYVLVIFFLQIARAIGPFPFILLAFGVLLAFGNIVTAFSIRYKINLHFILMFIALLIGGSETHYVRTVETDTGNKYGARPDLAAYFRAWITDRKAALDSMDKYTIYFVLANGGASRSAYWTAAALGKLEDSSLSHHPADRFSDHVFAVSGTSGGGVGVAAFFSMLRGKQANQQPVYDKSARAFLRKDYFTYTFARMLGPDFFNYIFHVTASGDRAAALETSFEDTSYVTDSLNIRLPFYDRFSNFPALTADNHTNLPILFVNTTRMQDGNPGVVTNIRLDSSYNNRVDVVSLLEPSKDISITSASILGARFPYLSPAGRIGDSYFVDGGYFDNSGAGVIQETIRGIINLSRTDSSIARYVSKFHFKVLHILNSPVTGEANIQAVAPIKNDLAAPLLTIVGAYDMQTTVNDGRLINFLKDINNYSPNQADYIPISLYLDDEESKKDSLNIPEPPYAMNWFMSDTTLNRIDKRLQTHPKLNNLENGWIR